jgi:hypothetical protein
MYKKPNQLIRSFIKRKKLFNILMKNNRPRLRTGGGHIEPYADRFLYLWCVASNKPIKVNRSELYQRLFNTVVGSSAYGSDKILKEHNLVEITNEIGNTYEVRVIKNKFNETLYNKCKKYLIKYMWDDVQEYRDLEKNSQTY